MRLHVKRARVPWILLNAVVAAGCSALLGLDEYSVKGTGATGGSGGDAGSSGSGEAGSGGSSGSGGNAGSGASAGSDGGDAGSSGSAGSGGSAGSSGTNGSGGSSGVGGTGSSGAAGSGETGGSGNAGGTGGDAGSGGSAGGTAPACDGEVFTPNWEVVRSCILNAGCSPGLAQAPSAISACVTENRLAVYPEETCAQGATTCAQIHACHGDGFTNADQCPSGAGRSCKDGIGLDCDPSDEEMPGYFVDCNKYGGTCDISSGAAECRVQATCSTEQGEFRCDGNLLYDCFGGKGYGYDCSKFGATCVQTTDSASCVYEQESCSSATTSCVDDTAEICDAGGLYRLQCGAVGLGCTTAGYPHCLAAGCTVSDHADCKERCTSASTLSFCYGGAKVEISCKDYGFSRCDEFDDDTAICWNG